MDFYPERTRKCKKQIVCWERPQSTLHPGQSCRMGKAYSLTTVLAGKPGDKLPSRTPLLLSHLGL